MTSRILPAVVSCLILVYIGFSFDISALLESAGSFEFQSLVIILLLLVLNVLIVSARLWQLLSQFGFKVPFLAALRANVAGLVSSLVMIALAGAIVGRQALLKQQGVTVSGVALLTTYERAVIALVGAGLCALGGFVVFGGHAIRGIFVQLPIWQIIAAVLFAILLGWVIARSKHETLLFKRLMHSRVIAKIGTVGLITCLGQISTFFAYMVAIRSFDTDVGVIDMIAAAAIVSFAASIPLSVNGWGIREVASIFAFGQIGIDATDAVAVSILIGLFSTLAVVATAPVLYFGKERKSGSSPHSAGADQRVVPIEPLQKLTVWILGYLATIFVFFQVYATIDGSQLSLNLADPFAVVGVTLAVVLMFTASRPPFRLSPMVWMWLAAILFVLLLGFTIGVYRFGITSWALNNRLVGWFVLMGYFTLGAMVVGNWGQHGLRRIAELVVTTGVAVVLTTIALSTLETVFETRLLYEFNYQGFSANRNTFAFQLVIALCCWIAVSPLRHSLLSRGAWALLAGILLYGIWRTESKTGIAIGGGVLVFAMVFRLGDRLILGGMVGLGFLYALSRVFRTVLDPVVTRHESLLENVIASAGGFNPESLFERWNSVIAGLKMWLDHPVFGGGLGAFLNEASLEQSKAVVIHSTPAWILAEFGLFGLLLVASFPLACLAGVLRHRRVSRQPRTTLMLTMAVAFVGFSLMHEISFQRLFWLLLGVGFGTFVWRGSLKAVLPKEGRPLRVLHVITTLNRGGAESMLVELLRFKDSRTQNFVASLASDGVLSGEVRAIGTPLLELGFKQFFPNPLGFWRLVVLIREQKPDVVQGWMYHGDLVAMAALLFSGRWGQTRLYWGVRCSDMDLSRYGTVLKTIVRLCAFLARFTDGVIANSEVGRQAHEVLGYRPPEFTVVHNGLDLEKFAPDAAIRTQVRDMLGLSEDTRVLMHVARVDPMKDHLRLLNAMKSVPEVTLVLIGHNTDHLPKQDGVIALGLRGDVPQLLKAGDGVIMSSAFGEGFPNALAEGMASALVPISTDVGDAALMADGTGWVVPPSDTDAMVRSIRAFSSLSPEELSLRKAEARKAIARRFTVSATVDKFLSIYDG